MSLAYRCDLCGNFVSNEADAQSERTIAQESTSISNTMTLLELKLDLNENHVCDGCFGKALRKTKAWVAANL